MASSSDASHLSAETEHSKYLRSLASGINYDVVKERFYKELNDYYTDRESKKCKKWYRNDIKRIIGEIKAAELNGDINLLHVNPFEVIQENGEDILILKKRGPNNVITRISPLEDAFDIIIEAHINSEHMGSNKTYNLIKPSHSIPKIFVDIFVSLCTVCNKDRNSLGTQHIASAAPSSVARFNHTIQVSFINMEMKPDGSFNYILHYVDKSTGFMLMRSLVSYIDQMELSTELFTIFTDFGPPQIIETYYSALIEQSLELIKQKCPDWKINVIQLERDFYELSRVLIYVLQDWMTENDCRNWSIGCRMLQFQKNNAKDEKPYSPYNSVFGYNVNCAIFNNPVTENTNKTEESIENRLINKSNLAGTVKDIIDGFEIEIDTSTQYNKSSDVRKELTCNEKIIDVDDDSLEAIMQNTCIK